MEKLEDKIMETQTFTCFGIDPDPNKVKDIETYFAPLVEKLSNENLIVAIKPNIAFFSAYEKGEKKLKKIIRLAKKNKILCILDSKRGDIANTSRFYAKESYEKYKADGTTISPYLGFDSIKPFLDYSNKLNFILCKTSNKGSKDFQEIKIKQRFFYEYVFEKICEWQKKKKNLGAVVGATDLNAFRKTIRIEQKMNVSVPLLIPGIGKQGGNLEMLVKELKKAKKYDVLINSSRGIAYAGKGKQIIQKAMAVAKKMRAKYKELFL